MISNLISRCSPVKVTTILGSIWTDNLLFCDKSMLKDSNHMLTDMVECQDLIATLDIASKQNITIPKLSAKLVKQKDDYDFIKVTIESKIPEEFAQLMWNIQDGKYDDLSYRIKEGHFISIRYTEKMNQYILSTEDNLNIINSTL
tara:strand:- start:167 stop:601 length:435 start_codon:yes stop_codon:yes gene_type:complete